MLNEQEIRRALHATRVVPLEGINPHGPLGLEHLAAAVQPLAGSLSQLGAEYVRRPILFPLHTWEKLNHLAHTTSGSTETELSAGDLAAAIIEQYVATAEQ